MLERAVAILEDVDHPSCLGAAKFLAEQGYGKPSTQLDVTSGGKPLQKQVIVVGG
jgi:hypothetical protein